MPLFKNPRKTTVIAASTDGNTIRFKAGEEREIPDRLADLAYSKGLVPVDKEAEKQMEAELEARIRAEIEAEAAKKAEAEAAEKAEAEAQKRSEAAKKAAATKAANKAAAEA